ncbi:spermidine synthase [Pseudoalteromonas fuliginea]|uniref:SAM-dependent methyltransferase n=1 Tax=Pseudoalteromonas fuliginea TaxID=1872678 RepID=A0ABD3YAR1_9GAMM|nr:methyltransferase [Pseudoalteromonas fuliginea]KDC51572.1 SAM-dependent methyltransferase [Pseudoalteromonas fuliginea]KJZ29762.1 SAM-dependent methyltransferase [Pseudoalteromonas fuliginea]
MIEKINYINSLTGLLSDQFIENSHSIGQLIYWHKCSGDHIQIRGHEQLRWLLINDTLQSVIDLNDPSLLLFPHLLCLGKQWQALSAPKKVLELGLGGGAIRNYLQHKYPKAHITSVEKNADIIDCYTQFFSSNKNDQLLCADAQQVLKSAQNIDWIILDLFSQIDAPRFLFEEAFYKKIYLALNNNGVLFINFLSQHESQLKQLKQLLLDVFGCTVSPQKITGYVNHIVVVTKKLKQIS